MNGTMKFTTALNLILAVASVVFSIMLLDDGKWGAALVVLLLTFISLGFNLYAMIEVAKEYGLVD